MGKKIKGGDRVIVVFEAKIAKDEEWNSGNCLCTAQKGDKKMDLNYLKNVTEVLGGQLIKVSK